MNSARKACFLQLEPAALPAPATVTKWFVCGDVTLNTNQSLFRRWPCSAKANADVLTVFRINFISSITGRCRRDADAIRRPYTDDVDSWCCETDNDGMPASNELCPSMKSGCLVMSRTLHSRWHSSGRVHVRRPTPHIASVIHAYIWKYIVHFRRLPCNSSSISSSSRRLFLTRRLPRQSDPATLVSPSFVPCDRPSRLTAGLRPRCPGRPRDVPPLSAPCNSRVPINFDFAVR